MGGNPEKYNVGKCIHCYLPLARNCFECEKKTLGFIILLDFN